LLQGCAPRFLSLAISCVLAAAASNHEHSGTSASLCGVLTGLLLAFWQKITPRSIGRSLEG